MKMSPDRRKADFRVNKHSKAPDQSAEIYSLIWNINIGIKHGFSYINIRQVPWEVLKTKAEGHSFQHLPRDLGNVNALKNHV